MQIPITVVADLGAKPRISIVPGNHSRKDALAMTKAPEGCQVWVEMYDSTDPAGEAQRIQKRAKELLKYLNQHRKDIPTIAP